MTELNVPELVLSASVLPPEIRGLPLASKLWMVKVVVLDPSATMVAKLEVIVVVLGSAFPTTKLTTASSTIEKTVQSTVNRCVAKRC